MTIPSQRKHHTLAGSSHIVGKAVAQPWHSEGPSCKHLAAHGGQGGEKRKTCKALDANIEASIVTIPSQRKHHTLAGSSHIVGKAVAQRGAIVQAPSSSWRTGREKREDMPSP